MMLLQVMALPDPLRTIHVPPFLLDSGVCQPEEVLQLSTDLAGLGPMLPLHPECGVPDKIQDSESNLNFR